jgi:hypothetical protein
MAVRSTSPGFRLVSSAALAASLSATALAQENPAGVASAAEEDAASAGEERTGILPLPEYGGGMWDRGHLTGDWNGARNAGG